jgi:hypothetical protein
MKVLTGNKINSRWQETEDRNVTNQVYKCWLFMFFIAQAPEKPGMLPAKHSRELVSNMLFNDEL